MKQHARQTAISAITALTAIVLSSANGLADDHQWGHWRGPIGNGISTTATPPTQWSETKNVKWKVAIPGKGSGSPVIWDNRVFVVSAISTDGGNRESAAWEFKLFCYDRKTGDKLWEQTAVTTAPHQGVHSTNNFASASPCTDGKHVYAFYGSRGLYCYTMDGTLVWKRDDFGKMQTRNGFGEGASPTLSGDKIIVPWDHEGQSALYALNKLTGKTVWKTDRDEPTNWSTPLIVTQDGKSMIVMNGQTCARGYDLESGDELWRCSGQTQRPCASAVASEGLIFVGSGFRGSYLGAFKFTSRGDIKNSDSVAWSVQQNTPDIASPLLSDGRLYFHKAKTGILSCFNAATGKPHFSASRIPGLGNIYASPIAAGGYVFLTDRDGTTVVIEDAEQLKRVATNSVGETVDATPAPVGSELFIRGERHLFCISE
jgi:outer membrane protein assembly factor BamB